MSGLDFQWLLRCADELGAHEHVPLQVEVLAAKIGVPVYRTTGESRQTAELRRTAAGTYEILLYSRHARMSYRWSSRDRFAVAHELAHALIEERLGWNPSDPQQYFARERWCHRFAGRLLIPQALVDTSDTGDAKAGISKLLRLSHQCGVSRRVAAWRLADAIKGVGYAELQWTLDRRRHSVLQVRWSAPELRAHGLTQNRMHGSGQAIHRVARDAAKNRFATVTFDDLTNLTLCRSLRQPDRYLAHMSLGATMADKVSATKHSEQPA
jgi:Zn-dependent peptidase ImmA (M78 family)